MAITYQSSQTATNATDSITITKPTNTAVGDMLIAVISTQNTINVVPTGWSTLTSKTTSGAGSITTYVYYVVATSTQVSASNFTWSNVGTAVRLSGGIARFTGEFHSTPFAIFASDDDASGTSPTYTNTVTPVTINSTLLFCSGAGSNGSGTVTVSAQAIATSNPSWTEAFDTAYQDGSGNTQAALAYAARPQITATGDSSATLSGARESNGIMVVFRPQVVSTTTETESVIDSTKRQLNKRITETESVVDTLIAEKDRTWVNPDKTSTNWVNQDKN